MHRPNRMTLSRSGLRLGKTSHLCSDTLANSAAACSLVPRRYCTPYDPRHADTLRVALCALLLLSD